MGPSAALLMNKFGGREKPKVSPLRCVVGLRFPSVSLVTKESLSVTTRNHLRRDLNRQAEMRNCAPGERRSATRGSKRGRAQARSLYRAVFDN